MKPESRRLLEKSERAIRAAETLLLRGDADFAVARGYYAMFYAAEALLHERGLHFRKHSAVHGAIGEHLVKTGALDARFHRSLLDAFDRRIIGDYGVDAVIGPEEAGQLIEQAESFLKESRRLLGDRS